MFWIRWMRETLGKHWVIASLAVRLIALKLAIERAPSAEGYSDLALTPTANDADASFELLTRTTGAARAVGHLKRVAQITAAASRDGVAAG